MRINSYTAQSTLMQGKDLDRINAKLERAQQTVQANEKDFANFSRALQDTVQKWEQDWKAFCDACQDMEDDRMEFMKDNMWAYANAVSTVCVADDEVSQTDFYLRCGVVNKVISPARRYALPWSNLSQKRTQRTLFVTTAPEMRCQTPLNSSITRIPMPSPPRPHGQHLVLLISLVRRTAPTSPAKSLSLHLKRNQISTTMLPVSDLAVGTRYRFQTRLSTAPPARDRSTDTALVVLANPAVLRLETSPPHRRC